MPKQLEAAWVSQCLLKQRMMEVVVTTEAMSRAKLQSNHHHQQTNIQFSTGRMPFLSPNQQCQSTEGKVYNNTAASIFRFITIHYMLIEFCTSIVGNFLR